MNRARPSPTSPAAAGTYVRKAKMMTGIRHEVTAADLRAPATTDRRSLLRDAGTLIDCDEGIIRVPFRVVEETLGGRGRLTLRRLLYAREWFIDDGVLIGKTPRTADGGSLDERLAVIADGLNARRGPRA